MKSLNRRKIKFFLPFIILSLIILKFFNTPYNLYSIFNWNYEQRMEQNYGFCEKESWGFSNFVINKFDLKNKEINIINDGGYVTLERIFNIKKINSKNANFLIILNYKNENVENIFDSKYDFIENYKVRYRYNNCFLLVLND